MKCLSTLGCLTSLKGGLASVLVVPGCYFNQWLLLKCPGTLELNRTRRVSCVLGYECAQLNAPFSLGYMKPKTHKLNYVLRTNVFLIGSKIQP